jgi:hypothetical protein
VSGRARDLLTSLPDEAAVVDEARIEVAVDDRGCIVDVDSRPARRGCEVLVSRPIGFGMRSAIRELLAALAGSPLGLLVDDLSHVQSPAHYGMLLEEEMQAGDTQRQQVEQADGPREGPDVCAGLRAGSDFALHLMRREPLPLVSSEAPSLTGTDPLGWHGMPAMSPRQSRRVRRLDVWWHSEHELAVDAMFRDTAMRPDHTERIVHEYALAGIVDATTMTLTSLTADPRVLPFPGDCPLAAASAELVVGERVETLRSRVGAVSRGAVSCTHLNDMMRSLADVQLLAARLPVAAPAGPVAR